MTDEQRKKVLAALEQCLHARKCNAPFGQTEKFPSVAALEDALTLIVANPAPAKEAEEAAEKFAKDMIASRGNPHWHDLRDCFLAGRQGYVPVAILEQTLRQAAETVALLRSIHADDVKRLGARLLWGEKLLEAAKIRMLHSHATGQSTFEEWIAELERGPQRMSK